MHVSLKDLALHVQGTLSGDGAVILHNAATLRDAGPQDISFLEKADEAHLLKKTRAAAAVVPCGFQTEQMPVIQVADVAGAFASIVMVFRPPRQTRRIGISPQAVVSPTAKFGPDVDVHPLAAIDDAVEIGAHCTIHSGVRIMAGCKIADHVTIFPNAVLYEETVVGSHCIIHAGAVLGAYGYGYTLVGGRHQLSAQLGNVVLGDYVEVGACSTIDRGTYGPTLIGEGTKLDNQVQVAHNCRVGNHNLFCSQVGVAGSAVTGDHVVLGGKAGLCPHVELGDRAMVGAMAGVTHSLPGDNAYALGPALPVKEARRVLFYLHRLPELRNEIKQLERAVEKLQAAQLQAAQPDGPHQNAA